MCWALFIINHLRVILAPIFVLSGSADKASERDGLEGSLVKFGLSFGAVRFTNVPDSEGMVKLWKFVHIIQLFLSNF